MYQDVTYSTGVTRACIAAGPIFVTAIALFTTVSVPNPVVVDASSLLFLTVLLPAVVVGAFLAVVPSLVGTAVLARMAAANAGLRLPVAWALIGGLLAGGSAAFEETDGVTTAAFAATGAICALLCRSGTRWSD